MRRATFGADFSLQLPVKMSRSRINTGEAGCRKISGLQPKWLGGTELPMFFHMIPTKKAGGEGVVANDNRVLEVDFRVPQP